MGILFVAFAAPANAKLTYTEYSGWDSRHFFRMVLNIDLNPTTQVVIIDGGRIEFASKDTPYRIEQAAGAKVPKLKAKQMAGDVFFSQANIGISTTMFLGNLVGNLPNGTLTANSVTFVFRGQTEQVNFVMTTGAPATAPAPTAPGKSPTPVSPPNHALPAGVYLDTSNTGAAQDSASPKRPTFSTASPIDVTGIWTYHWNNGRGETPGTIELISLSGAQFGPWRATGSPGSNNVENANWNVQINQPLPAGTYEVVDSSPSTWSENSQSQGMGFARVSGHAQTASPTPAPIVKGIIPTPAPTTIIMKRVVPVATPVPTSAPGPTRLLLDSSNVGGVVSVANPTRPTFFSTTSIHITEIWTYHWNNGRGETPGTISLVSVGNGATYGPWKATGSSGSNNAQDVNWTVQIDQLLPAGTYQVADSSPSTWSENVLSKGIGFAKVWGHQ
jgi:hypothetical protein